MLLNEPHCSVYLGGLRPKGEFLVDSKSLYSLLVFNRYREEKSVFIHFAHTVLLGFALVEKHLQKNRTRITVWHLTNVLRRNQVGKTLL